MKRLLLIASTAILLSSCSVVQKTSKSLSLTTDAVQLPTFYEISVSDKLARKDTTWVRSWFSSDRSSVEDIKSFVTASILESHKADVLVEPKLSLKETGYPWEKVYNLTIAGYPAKYKNFHTATPAEFDMLYGKRVNEYLDKSDLSLVLPMAGGAEHQVVSPLQTSPNKFGAAKTGSFNSRPMEKRTYVDLLVVPESAPFVSVGRGRFTTPNLYRGVEVFFGEFDNDLALGIMMDYRYYFGRQNVSPFVGATVGAAFMDEEFEIPLHLTAGLSMSKFDLGISANYLLLFGELYPSISLRFRF